MKKLIYVFCVLVPLVALAAADKFIHQLPVRSTPADTDSIPADVEAAPGVWSNFRVLVGDIRGSSTNAAPVFYTTNLYVTTNYVRNEFVTNAYTTLEYVTNLYVTTNFNNYSYITNLYASTEYVTNLYTTLQYVTNQYVTTNFNTYSYITNLYVTLEYATNVYITTNFVEYSYITNLSVNRMTVNNAFTTNLYYLNASPQDTAWSGPTNYISYTNGSLRSYATVTPCSITSLVDETASHGNPVLLCLTNAASSNVNVYLPTAYKSVAGNVNPIVLTNGNIAEIWFYSASNRKTVISQQFY